MTHEGRSPHKTVYLKLDGFDEADIDENIADFIMAMWKAEIRTHSSCESGSPQSNILIDMGMPYGEEFLEICCQDKALLSKIWHGNEELVDHRQEAPDGYWRLYTHFGGLGETPEEDGPPPRLRCWLAVSFPFTDKATVIGLLEKETK